MYCSQCGHESPDDSQFCPKCGKNIGETALTEQKVVATGSTASGNPGLQKFLAYFGITALLVGLATVIYYLNFFSVTISTPQISIFGQPVLGSDITNIGLLSERQNGLIVGISEALFGGLLLIACIFVDVRGGAKNIPVLPLAIYAIACSVLLGIGVQEIRAANARSIVQAENQAKLDAVQAVNHQKALEAENVQAADNLKKIGLTILQYAQDNDEMPPPMRDPSTLQNALNDYIPAAQTFLNPVTSQPFLPNPKCNTIPLAEIDDPASLVIVYDQDPEPDGNRWVLYADGHIQQVSTDTWTAIAENKQPNTAASSDMPFGQNDTLVPSVP